LRATNIGVRKDEQQAFKSFHKASKQGHGGAKAVLGRWYLLGEGVRADKQIAEQYFTQAAELGSKIAAVQLDQLKLSSVDK
jgi:TPR repeat protein